MTKRKDWGSVAPGSERKNKDRGSQYKTEQVVIALKKKPRR